MSRPEVISTRGSFSSHVHFPCKDLNPQDHLNGQAGLKYMHNIVRVMGNKSPIALLPQVGQVDATLLHEDLPKVAGDRTRQRK